MDSYLPGEDNRELAELYQVAHMYYELGMLQPEIAEKMYFSRSKVSRLLKQAREAGIVQITVKRLYYRDGAVEDRLKSAFGLKDAVVVAVYDATPEQALDIVSDFAADYISSRISGNFTLGITNGNTVGHVVRKLKKVKPCSLRAIQLLGASDLSYGSMDSQALTNRLRDTFGGEAVFLNAPLYVDDLYVKNLLLQDPNIYSVYREMTRCNMIVTGIGIMDTPQELTAAWHGYMAPRHRAELEKHSAVGSICAQYFDGNGDGIGCEWSIKCMAMPLTDIRNSSNVVAVALGEKKVPAILGAVRGHFPKVLITDRDTALSVLDLANQH